MNTITFTNKNSFADFGIILSRKIIGEAKARTNYIDVPARDGLLDLTEAFGEVKFEDRTHTFLFEYIGTDKDWQATLSALNNYINGQKHKIFTESNYYWVGRCFVKDAETQKGIRKFEIVCSCEPYKYKLSDTIIEVNAESAEVTRTIINDRKTATPKITVLSGAPLLSWTDKKTGAQFQIALSSGFDNKVLNFKFYEGANAFKVSGGSIKLTYREASL